MGWYLGSGTASPVKIAAQGEKTPLGGTFGFAGRNTAASINATGQVVFLADVPDAGAVVLFSWTSADGVQTVVSTNDSLPEGANTVLRAGPPATSDTEVMVRVLMAGGQATYYASELKPGTNGVRKIVAEFDPAPELGTVALPYNIYRLHTNPDGSIRGGIFHQLLRGREGRNLLVVMTKSPYEEWRRWEQTATGRRGEAYEEEKASRAGKLLRDAEGIFGSLADAKVIDAYSPLTLRDRVDTPEGSPYGILRSVRQLPVAATLHRLAPAGLWFAGQNALSPGVLGTLLGSFHAVRQMIGAERFASIHEEIVKGREKPGLRGGG